MHPPFLTNHAAITAHRDGLVGMRNALRRVEDFARQLQREREEVDPDGSDVRYEALRQRERAAHDELVKLRANVDRLFDVLRHLEAVMLRLAQPEP